MIRKSACAFLDHDERMPREREEGERDRVGGRGRDRDGDREGERAFGRRLASRRNRYAFVLPDGIFHHGIQ